MGKIGGAQRGGYTMSKYTDAFDTICGNLSVIDIMTVTENSIREQAEIFRKSGETVTNEEINDAIRGLREYQAGR